MLKRPARPPPHLLLPRKARRASQLIPPPLFQSATTWGFLLNCAELYATSHIRFQQLRSRVNDTSRERERVIGSLRSARLGSTLLDLFLTDSPVKIPGLSSQGLAGRLRACTGLWFVGVGLMRFYGAKELVISLLKE